MPPTPPERSSPGRVAPAAEDGRSSEPNVIPLRSRGWLAPGDRIGGKYKLLTEIGEGGMGAVWLAHYEALDIEVAIKVIRSEVRAAGGAEINERLLREARSAARLGHPAIVRITDFGETEAGDPYFVMELLEGEDLARTLERRGRISAVKTVRSLLPIAHALAAAHDKHIVHRDVKPENIIFAELEDGSVQPKLIDFGVAKLDRPANERLTMAGALLGSPGYMSPEQARGEDVDERADIWAFCAVVYEMITGRLPFQGKNYHALLRSIVEDEVQPLTDLGRGDEALWSILAKGLTKNPDKRWQSMRKLGAALARWLIVHDVTEDICGASLLTTWLRSEKLLRVGDAFDSILPPRIEGRTDSEPDIAVRVATTTGESTSDLIDVTPASSPAAKSSPAAQPSVSSELEVTATSSAAQLDDEGRAAADLLVPITPAAASRPRRPAWRTAALWLLVALVGAAGWVLWRYGEAIAPRLGLAPAAAPAVPAERAPTTAVRPASPAIDATEQAALPAPTEAPAVVSVADSASSQTPAASALPATSAATATSAAATAAPAGVATGAVSPPVASAAPSAPAPASHPGRTQRPASGRHSGQPAATDLKRPSF